MIRYLDGSPMADWIGEVLYVMTSKYRNKLRNDSIATLNYYKDNYTPEYPKSNK